jgi:hypothetical protein
LGVVLRRLGIIAGGVLALWLVLLVALGVAGGARQAKSTRERLGESMQATVTIGDLDLALVRGHLTFEHLALRRDDAIGHLSLDIANVNCELLPLGLALFDRDCRDLSVSGVRLEVSAAALFKMQHRPKHRPVHADHVVIDDATLVFLPSAFVPGLGQVTLAIEHAEAGPTTFRTPLSWLFNLRELRARFDLPAGITLRIGYANGMLTASGSLFGSSPVELPVQLPVADAAHDAHEELVLLVKAGRDIAEQLVAKRAEDWLRSKLTP